MPPSGTFDLSVSRLHAAMREHEDFGRLNAGDAEDPKACGLLAAADDSKTEKLEAGDYKNAFEKLKQNQHDQQKAFENRVFGLLAGAHEKDHNAKGSHVDHNPKGNRNSWNSWNTWNSWDNGGWDNGKSGHVQKPWKKGGGGKDGQDGNGPAERNDSFAA